MKKINIAIDGPAGAGKSTIAKAISKNLEIIYMDTGAMYRAVALKSIKEGLDCFDKKKISSMVENINLKIEYEKGEQKVVLDGENVNGLIRTPEVTKASSNVAVIPEVRIKLVELQREIAKEKSIVMDGRDIGTYVLPNADIKIFLNASPEERAKRRFIEQKEKGMDTITIEEVKKDISYRDKNDSEREFAPLKKAEDAIEIDTTNMSVGEVINKIMCYVNELLWKEFLDLLLRLLLK